ncbi:hypothetical protein ACU4GI_19420 [Cupriavidus basilensis]
MSSWIERLAPFPVAAKLVSALMTSGTPVTEMRLGKIERAALHGYERIGTNRVSGAEVYRLTYYRSHYGLHEVA